MITKKELSKHESKAAEIAKLEQRRDDLIEQKRSIEKQINEILPTEVGGRLKGMRLQADADATNEHIHRAYEAIATRLAEIAEIEKAARFIRREWKMETTGIRHLKREGRRAEIERTLAELEPSRDPVNNLNVEKLCKELEAELKTLDARGVERIRGYEQDYLLYMGVPVDAATDDESEEVGDDARIDWSNIHGRPRKRRLDAGVSVAVEDTETPEPTERQQQGRPRVGSAAHLGW